MSRSLSGLGGDGERAVQRRALLPAGRMTLRRGSLRFLLPGTVLLIVVAGGGFAALENDTVETFGAGVWWALSLATTVGFVGAEPATTGGRILSAIMMVAGFALLAMTTAAVASLFVRDDEAAEERAMRAFEARSLRELDDLRAHLERIERRLDSPP